MNNCDECSKPLNDESDAGAGVCRVCLDEALDNKALSQAGYGVK